MKKSVKKTTPLSFLAPLTDSVSYRILMQIKKRPNKPVNVIYRSLKMEQSVCSAKLAKLKKAKYVIGNRRGREILYVLNKDTFDKAANAITAKFM